MPEPSPKVLRRWDIGEPYDLVPVPGSAHECWRVRTESGTVLLKRYRDADRRRVLREHAVTTALDATGLPVPAPIPARSGRTLVQADQRLHALYPWTDGLRREGLELSLAQCRELGELLGRLHGELSRLSPVQQTLLVPTSRAGAAVGAIDRLLASLPDGPDGDDFAALAGRRLRERRALLVEFADHQPPEVEAFAVGPVHGAFTARNLLYGRTRRVAAVVGWGGLRDGPIALDVVRAATSLFSHGGDEGMDLGRIEAFIRGHASAYPLDPGQVCSAVHRHWWEALCDVGPLRRHYLDRDSPAPGTAVLVAWWTAHLDRTLDVFATACDPEPQGQVGYHENP